MDVLDIIQGKYPSLSRTQKQIADFFLNNSDRACFMPLKEVAAETSTTEVTVLCFCSKLGFNGYMDFKKHLQQDIKMRMSPNAKIQHSLNKLVTEENPLEEIIAREKNSLERTYRYLDHGAFKRCIDEIKQSRHIYLVSQGVTSVVADFLGYRLEQIGISCSKINVTSPGNIISSSINVNPHHLYFIITFPQYSSYILSCSDFLSHMGARMLCLTDSINSPVARNSIAALTCNSESSVFYNSMTSAISMIEFLVSALAIECSDEYLGHKERVDNAKQLYYDCQKKAAKNEQDTTSIKL